MNRAEIIEALDQEIDKLTEARGLIQGSNGLGPALAKFVAGGSALPGGGRKRQMSAEGRRRIAEAQKLRWAKHKAAK